MKLFEPSVKKLIEKKDYDGLGKLLHSNPHLANEGITIPFDVLCIIKAHPLHRICDPVHAGELTDLEAVRLANVLLSHGAQIDGDKNKKEGTPLLAAASLHAEQVAILYIDKGADIHYTYKDNGATALHWASFVGRDRLVDKLITSHAFIDLHDNTYKSTPLGWAIHSLQSNDVQNMHNQRACIKLLLKAGAEIRNLDTSKKEYIYTLANGDSELESLIQ